MCFKPKANTKVLLSELDRDKRCLEQDNTLLRTKLTETQEAATRVTKERDGLRQQRVELEARLQQRSSHVTRLLTQVTSLRSSFASRLQELFEEHLSAASAAGQSAEKAPTAARGAAQIAVLQPECVDGEASPGAVLPRIEQRSTQPGKQDSRISGGIEDSGCCTASIEEQLDNQICALAQVHDEATAHVEQLQVQLREVGSDRGVLQAEVASIRRRLELAEASATDQQEVLLLRCSALEQENEQLTGMNQEVQHRLEAALAELSSLKKQWNTDAGQLTRQAAEVESSNRRVREAEAEIRTLGTHLAEAVAQAQEASTKAAELQEQANGRAAELGAMSAVLVAREAELETARAEVRRLEELATHHKQLYEATAAELLAARASERSAKDGLEATRIQLDGTRRDLAAAAQQLASQGQALADTQEQLQESRAALASTGERLTRALEDLAGAEAQAAEANAQYLNTKQSVINTAKQLANMARDHSAALARLHALEAEAATLREQLAASQTAEADARARADASSATSRDARAAADTAEAEVRRLRSAYESTAADLRRKIMVLTAIARMANKGQAAAGGGRAREGQDGEQADSYSAVTSEQRLRLKICEAPLPLLGALTSGIMDSSRLRHLALDMDTSREVTWEKAGLRICCLAAAVGLNNSLQTLQLGGWTWGELGNGTALPFLALGGGGGMLRRVQLATNLFDVEAAAMLRDLLAAGLVELAAGTGEEEEPGNSGGRHDAASAQGTLRLYSGNDRLDGWYRDMLQMASSSGSQHQTPRPSLSGQPLPSASSSGNGRSAPSLCNDAVSTCSSSGVDDASSVASGLSRPSSSRGVSGATAGQPVASQSVDCDLSAEALESHHMVLVMTVLLTCPGLRRLRLDGNKLGDGGAALLALGLSGNTGLRELNLSRNNIRAAGARSLARCLEGANSTLLRLDMSGQRMEGLGAAGAEALAQALRVNRTLEDLNLSSCGLAGSAAAVFSGAIRAAGASRPVSAPSTSGDGSSRPSTASSVCSANGSGGGSLRRLALSGNGIDAPTAKALQAAAAERPGLALVL